MAERAPKKILRTQRTLSADEERTKKQMVANNARMLVFEGRAKLKQEITDSVASDYCFAVAKQFQLKIKTNDTSALPMLENVSPPSTLSQGIIQLTQNFRQLK